MTEEVNDPEESWRTTLPSAMQPVAKRHGRVLFAFCANNGTVNSCVQLMDRRFRGNRELVQSLHTLISAFNSMSQDYVSTKGWTGNQITECTTDIQRAFLLTQGTPEGKSNGGLLLPGMPGYH